MALADEIVEEFAKVRTALHTILGKIHLPSETEVTEVRNLINSIGGTPQKVEAPVPAVATPAAAPVATVDPLAGYSLEQLQAELNARSGQGSN